MKKVLVSLVAVTCGIAFADEMTVGAYKSYINGQPPMNSLAETYMSGVAMGVFYSNIYNMTNGQKPIFCIGKDVPLSGKDALRLFNGFLAQHNVKDHNDAYAVMVYALQAKYPCK